MLTVIAIAQAKPGKEKSLEVALLALVAHTRREAGCINYDLHRHVDKAGQFAFYENWMNLAALEQHRTSPHVSDFRAKASDLLAEPLHVELYEMISQPITKQ
jgi:quinol monooxygenase YgiN